MTELAQEVPCRRCGQTMEAGYATVLGVLGDPKIVFVVPGELTSPNPIRAFKQGLQNERQDEAYLLRGYRCPVCGAVEMIAKEKTPCLLNRPT
jgi:hypothetical protein